LARKEEKEVMGMVCDDCVQSFYAGKEFCKSCGFNLNSFNKEKEEEWYFIVPINLVLFMCRFEPENSAVDYMILWFYFTTNSRFIL